MAKIVSVDKESPLYGKVKVGDNVLRIDGRDFFDLIDYAYADSLETGELVIERDGKEISVAFEKEMPSDTLGLTFDQSVEITPVECRNNCIFCFVKQLQPGLRKTLYIKDDDYRLSFICGSYITCTNLSEKDVKRIIDYRLSPLYISVHATDETVRRFMLGIKRCPEQMPMLKRFIDAGITINAQIVLVAGINDGEILKKSLNELYEIGVSTVAIVPVGLTGHRQGLYNLSPLNKEQAEEAIKITEDFFDKHEGFCYCSDEMYQIAKKDVPAPEYYGSYDQIENGVGLIAKFFEELTYALSVARRPLRKRRVGVFTGMSAVNVMNKAKEMIEAKFNNVTINVYPVVNKFFGETVTVTGLVTATDIIRSYGDRKFEEDYLQIPSVMLKEFGDVFLDDKSVGDLSKALNKKIVVAHSDGEGFLKGILRGDRK